MLFIPVIFSFYEEVFKNLPVEILTNPIMSLFILIWCEDRTTRDKMVNCVKLILAESTSFLCSIVQYIGLVIAREKTLVLGGRNETFRFPFQS